MALSMDEQRMLAEIERRLTAEDPGLAARMSTFRRPGPLSVFRSARARVIGSLLTVAVVAMVSLMVYAILPFRSGSRTSSHQPATTVSSLSTGQPKIGAGSAKGPATASSSAKASGRAGTRNGAAAKPAASQASVHQSPASRTSANAAHAADGSGTTSYPTTFLGP